METSITLLGRVMAGERAAREEFAKRYAQVLRGWCTAWRVPANDIDDLVQETFLSVLAQLSNFNRQRVGGLRAWMRTIARRTWSRVRASAERQQNIALLEEFRRSRRSLDKLESELDNLVLRELIETSISRVKKRVEPKTWEAFRLTALEDMPGAEVASLLGMRVESVYMSRCRVQRHIALELERLGGTD